MERKIVYSSPWLRVREDHFVKDGKEQMYSVVERSNSVVVFPITPSGRTVSLRHFRHPTQNYSVEVPMGGVDDGETIEQAARRELLEEVEIPATELEHIGKFNPAPALTSQQVDVFIARVDESTLDNAKIGANEDDIEGFSIVNIIDIFESVSKGEITDGFTLGSLLFLKLHLENQDRQP